MRPNDELIDKYWECLILDTPSRTLKADTTSICSISLSTSGRHLLTASRCIKMWKMKKLKHVKVCY